MKDRLLFKEFAKYSSLNVLGMLGLSCYILADTFFVARGLGTAGLAALNLAIPVYSVVHGTGLMLGLGGATGFSIAQSRGDPHASAQAFTRALILAALFAAVFVPAGLMLPEKIAAFLGAKGEVLGMTSTYLQWILIFSPAFLLNDLLVCFVRNDGSPKLAMAAMLSGSFLNIVLDYVFIFPLGLGILGAVLATGTAPVAGIAVLAFHFKKKRGALRLARPDMSPRATVRLLSLGFPSLVTELSSGVVMAVFNALILSLCGSVGVAAYGVIANLSLVLVSVFTGLAQGVQPLISRAHGRGDFTSATKSAAYSMAAMLVISAAAFAALFVFADPVAGVFNSEGSAELQRLATQGIRLYFLAAPFVGFNIISAFFLTSTERALPAQIISLLRGLIVIIPAAVLLAKFFGLGGVWLSFPAAEAFTAVIAGINLKRALAPLSRRAAQ